MKGLERWQNKFGVLERLVVEVWFVAGKVSMQLGRTHQHSVLKLT